MKYTSKIDIFSCFFFGKQRCGKAQKTSGKRRVICLTLGLSVVSERLSGTAGHQAEMQDSYRGAQCISQILTDFSTLRTVGEYRLK